jgi:hypothetical protein
MAKKDIVDTDVTSDAAIIAELRQQLKEAETQNDKLKISLELQEAEYKSKMTSKPSGIKYGPSFNPASFLDQAAEQYVKDAPDQKFRFIGTHPTVYALRRSQGYEPVLNGKGEEVRYMDAVLAKMPMSRFDSEVKKPREEIRTMKKAAINQRFHDTGTDLGIPTFQGTIKYDGENK